MKARTSIYLMFIILFSIMTVGSADDYPAAVPDGTIYGHVYDANTKQPLSQAFVYCQEAKCSKPTTNSVGYYTIENCFSPSKTYTIECRKNGYGASSQTITTDQQGKGSIDFYLHSQDSGNLNQPPRLTRLYPDQPSPQIGTTPADAVANPNGYRTTITWKADAVDPEGDPIQYKFGLKGPVTQDSWIDQTSWVSDSTWIWDHVQEFSNGGTTYIPLGTYQIEVWIRDGKHSGPDGFDDSKTANYTILAPPNEPEYQVVPPPLRPFS